MTDVQKVGDQLVMVGADGHILLRGATSVTQAQTPVDLLLTAVYFVDARNGWAVGHDGVILHSTDAGTTWSRQLEGRAISQLMLKWAESEVARLEQPVPRRLMMKNCSAHWTAPISPSMTPRPASKRGLRDRCWMCGFAIHRKAGRSVPTG